MQHFLYSPSDVSHFLRQIIDCCKKWYKPALGLVLIVSQAVYLVQRIKYGFVLNPIGGATIDNHRVVGKASNAELQMVREYEFSQK